MCGFLGAIFSKLGASPGAGVVDQPSATIGQPIGLLLALTKAS